MLDRISKTLDPVGRVQEYTYDPVGNVTEITKNGGRAYTYTYDNVGNLTSAKNPMNQVQNFTYDSMNRLTSETDLAGKATSYTYDLNGQLTSVKDKNNAVTAYTYDANGNVTSITDPENRKISYTYDLLDRIINVTEGEAQTAQYEYDSVGNLTKYIDGNNKATTYTYNQLGEMTSITDPLGKVKEFSYNVNAMLDTVTNPDGSTVNYDYDVLDELISKSYDNEEDPQALYGYDLDGKRISMDDVAGTTGYEYDEVGRITAVNLSNGKKIKYSYDEYGNISKLTYPDNTTVQYTYNELDQLTQIKDRQGKITKYDRDANGNITKVTRPNNTYSTIEYDDMGNVIKVVNMGKNPYYNISEELSAFAYTYDNSGFITGEVAKNGRRIETSQYEYDERGQLVKVSQTVTENNKFVEETEMVYTYDGAGNRLSAVKTSSDKTLCNIQYTYNDNSQITDIESNCDDDKQTHIVLTYDENGNLKNSTCNDTEKVRDYTYDNENRLKAVKENGSLLMAALYDGNGDRIFRLDYRKNAEYVSNQAGTAENVYYPSGSVESAYDADVILNEMLIPNGVTNNTAINYELTGYINDINTEYTQTLMEFGANGNTTNIYEYGDGRNSATINGTKGYYLYDGRGSVAGLTGNSGGSMITYRYDAYGNTTKSNNTLNNPYQYNAEYTDSSTGLQYLRARYYDSSQGRFTTKDTLLGSTDKPITRNLYTYCGNNPLNITDPSGHGWFKNAVNGVKKAANKVVNTVKSGYNTAKNWANTHIVQPVKSFVSNTKQATSNAYNKGKSYVQQKYNQAKQSYNNTKTWVSNKWNNFKSDVSAKTQKAIEEAKRFVCTTKDTIKTNWGNAKQWTTNQINSIKNYFNGTSKSGEKRTSGPDMDDNIAYLGRFHDDNASGLWSGSVDVYTGYAEADMSLFNETYALTGDDSGEPKDSIFGVNSGVGVLKAEANGAFGTDDYNVHVSGNGNVLSAELNGSLDFGENGVEASIDAMASAASGSVSVGTTIDGITIDVNASGHAGAIGTEGTIYVKDGKIRVKAGAALAVGGTIDVTIDLSDWLEKYF